MKKFQVKGFTGLNAEFTDIIELPAEWSAAGIFTGDKRYNINYLRLKKALLDSSCPTEFLDVFDECSAELREDLVDMPGDIVLLAESSGCDNCAKDGNNEREENCDFEQPHGGFMLVLSPLD